MSSPPLSSKDRSLRKLLLDVNTYLRNSVGVPHDYEGAPRVELLERIASELTRIDSRDETSAPIPPSIPEGARLYGFHERTGLHRWGNACPDSPGEGDHPCSPVYMHPHVFEALIAQKADARRARETPAEPLIDWRASHAMALEHRNQLARYILRHCNYNRLRDHACPQCMPEGGDLVKADFVCSYHLAESFEGISAKGSLANRLHAAGYAPGGYSIKCFTCQKMVDGCDKRATRCHACALTAVKSTVKPECPVCFTTWGGCTHTANAKPPSASTDDNVPPSRSLPSSVECPKCRTQLAFEGDECGLCQEEAT